MSPRTSSALRPTRSRQLVRRLPQERPRSPDGSSAVGSANGSRTRSANSSWTTSGCATRSAGRSSMLTVRPPSCPKGTAFEDVPCHVVLVDVERIHLLTKLCFASVFSRLRPERSAEEASRRGRCSGLGAGSFVSGAEKVVSRDPTVAADGVVELLYRLDGTD